MTAQFLGWLIVYLIIGDVIGILLMLVVPKKERQESIFTYFLIFTFFWPLIIAAMICEIINLHKDEDGGE